MCALLSLPTLKPADRQQIFSLVPNAQPGSIHLISGEHGLIWPIIVQELCDHFAIRGPLRVVVGGNRFSFERLPLHMQDRLDQIEDVLDAVEITRGETCYQLLHALQKTPNSAIPLIVMDMLHSFYDENLTEREVDWVLRDSISNLKRLSRSAPLLVSASQDPARPLLIQTLVEAATNSISLLPAEDSHSPQPELF